MSDARNEPPGPAPGAGPAPRAESEAERSFFSGEGAAEADAAPPPRRRSRFLARNPVFAAVALAACGWLAFDLAPDVLYFFSSSTPVDLGAPGAYRLAEARANRFVRIQGVAAAQVPVTTSRGAERRVLGLLGTNLVVDRPGAGGAANVFEGRLLPERAAREYAGVVAALKDRGFGAADGWAVLRDGERPRERWSRPLLSLVVIVLGAVNLRALALHLME
ncbi:MAG: hypothetical protein ACJ79L_09615 [Anaeromyxobacteraceae bacterium]